uniref:ATP-dependent DNA helicase n=1 Tax=Angiostrongylus cantonensis TaxID=6313 RepID=A0A0K0DFT5_ANGCA
MFYVPRKLNVFLKSFQAKLDIMLSDPKKSAVYSHRSFLVLSAVSVAEIRKVRNVQRITFQRCFPYKVYPFILLCSVTDSLILGYSKKKHLEVISLSDEQRIVVCYALSSLENLIFTGGAGTGKSVVLRLIIDLLPASTTFVTALKCTLSNKNVAKQWKLSQLILLLLGTRRASYLSSRLFVKNSDHRVGGLPAVHLTSRGIQSLTALVNRCHL